MRELRRGAQEQNGSTVQSRTEGLRVEGVQNSDRSTNAASSLSQSNSLQCNVSNLLHSRYEAAHCN